MFDSHNDWAYEMYRIFFSETEVMYYGHLCFFIFYTKIGNNNYRDQHMLYKKSSSQYKFIVTEENQQTNITKLMDFMDLSMYPVFKNIFHITLPSSFGGNKFNFGF